MTSSLSPLVPANPMISERDAVKRERAAFIRGMRTSLRAARRGTLEQFPDMLGDDAILRAAARQTFPLPKVERPRVLKDAYNILWRLIGDEIQAAAYGNDFEKVCGGVAFYHPTIDRLRVWADLLATPNELVDADD